jgi:hypothetical protein
MDHRGISSKEVDWIHLGQDRSQWLVLVNMVMNLQALVPWS